MRRFIIAFVSHCERVWWDPSYEGMRAAVNAMLSLQDRLSMALGKKVYSTFCTHVDHDSRTSFMVDAKQEPDIVKAIISHGNEIGLHVHAPTAEFRTGFQDECIVHDADLLEELGIPRPTTYAAGDWVTGTKTVKELERGRFRVDCSAYGLEGPMNRFGVALNYQSTSLHPYKVAPSDISIQGSSSIVELPVSGNLTEFRKVVYASLKPIHQRIHERYSSLKEGVDVFQIFWHPFELAILDGKDCDAIREARVGQKAGKGRITIDEQIPNALWTFLSEIGKYPDVSIVSVRDAVEEWEKAFA